MKYHLVRIDPLRAARIAAAMYFLVGLAILPFVYVAFVLAPDGLGFSLELVLLSPFLTAGLGFASTTLGCFVYNWMARRVDGVELEMHRESGD